MWFISKLPPTILRRLLRSNSKVFNWKIERSEDDSATGISFVARMILGLRGL
jgi:hypothetical protein